MCAMLVGCSSPTRTGTAEPAPTAAVTIDDVPAPSNDGVTGCKDTVVLEAPLADAVCEQEDRFWPGSCRAVLRFMIRNCLDTPIEPSQLVLAEGGEVRVSWAFAPQKIEPGHEWVFERTTSLTGDYHLTLTYRVDGAVQAPPVTAALKITNSARTNAEVSCQECNGDFGRHGMSGIVSCLCRMQDAGKPCKDGRECMGKCVSRDGGSYCSEFRTVFGCHSYLPDGWSEQVHTPPVRLPHLCVD